MPVYFHDHPAFPPSVVSIPISASAAIHTSLDTTATDFPMQTGSHGGQEVSALGASSPSGKNPPDPGEGKQPPTPGLNRDPSAGNLGIRSRIRMGITITFPDGERNDQRYSAHPGWTVPHFKERMGRLLDTTAPVRVTVGPDWGELDHLGLVSD